VAAPARKQVVAALLDRYGETYARQAGLTVKDTPSALYRLLCLSTLLSARIRADAGGLGAALLRGGRCGGCRLELSGSERAQVKAAPPDEVVRCEECRRIMVRTAESGL
jgi:hypothetical protein